MKTTVEIPDDLFRQAKARAALEGLSLRDLVSYGIRLALQSPHLADQPHRTTFPLIRTGSDASSLTDADVSAALTELDEQEAEHYANVMRR